MYHIVEMTLSNLEKKQYSSNGGRRDPQGNDDTGALRFNHRHGRAKANPCAILTSNLTGRRQQTFILSDTHWNVRPRRLGSM